MYIITNALKNLIKNKTHNLINGSIIPAIVLITVIALIINTTTTGIIDDYKTHLFIQKLKYPGF